MIGYVEYDEYCLTELDMMIEILEICEEIDNFRR